MSDHRDTMLEWKVEPSSPDGGPLFLFEDEWLKFNDEPAVSDDNTKSTLQVENPTRAQIASELLEQLECRVEWIKEEPFQDWLEEKIELPIFDDLEPGDAVPLKTPVSYSTSYKPEITPSYRSYQLQPEHFLQPQRKEQQPAPQQLLPETTQSLLQEFETILGGVEACHQNGGTSTLTPPQSPPPGGRILFALDPIQEQQDVQYIQQVPIYGYEQFQPQQQQQQLQQQQPQQQLTNVVIQQSLQQEQQQQRQHNQPLQPDDSSNVPIHLNDCIQLQNQWGAENLSVNSLLIPSSPNDRQVSLIGQMESAVVNHYERSYPDDPIPSSPFASSSENGSFEDSSEDPDWSSDGYSKATDSKKTSASSNSSNSGSYRVGRRHRPYTRPSPEDKRVRKKEQNKNAATRYRQKKKQEIKEILSEEQELVLRNEKLNAKVSDLQREIGYLKGLMRDLCKAKGLMK